jgi:transcriptional regulator with XRE-family HTH domain
MEVSMSTQPVWTVMPAVVQAAGAGNFASILRVARTAAGLTLEEAGELAGYSASTLSRMETRPCRTWDVRELRRLAEVYGIPLTLFGLSTSTCEPPDASLSTTPDDGGEAMRRRDLLAGTVVIATGAALLPLDRAAAADGMADTVEDVLFGRLTAAPIRVTSSRRKLPPPALITARPATPSSPAGCRTFSLRRPPAATPLQPTNAHRHPDGSHRRTASPPSC